MARRVIAIGISARDELAKGADFLANAVKSTLGPFGQNFFLDKKNTITNDGVSVAREIQISDATFIEGKPGNELNNRGAAALREAATKTNDIAGDGTTTAIVLAQAIYKIGKRNFEKEGVVGKISPSEFVKKIKEECAEIVEKLGEMATPIETKEHLVASAQVSVEDPELAKIIGEMQFELGKNGFLLVETTAERNSSVEQIKGIRIDNGFGTSALVNNIEKQTLEVEECPILITSLTMRSLADWQTFKENVLDPLSKSGVRNLIFVARAWTDETIKFCMDNIKAGFNIYPLSAPYMDMPERMKDLAAVTGSVFYDSENSSFGDMVQSGLGFAQKVVAKRMEAIITGKDDEKTKQRVEKRVAELQEQLDGSLSDFEKKTLQERIAQLENGFALVKVGSPSDMERQRLYDKAVDAVNAVRAAFQEGTVPGAGLAYKQIADSLPDDYLLKVPLQEPYKLIMSSAPKDFVIEDWVRDPLVVMRVALEQACIAAASFATAGGVVTVEESKPIEQMLRRSVHNPQEE